MKKEKEKQMRKLEKKKGEEREKREGKKKEKQREQRKGCTALSGRIPSTKLGNNMTPIKGKLGKNTTPTCKRTTALNLQKDPQKRQQGFCDSSYPVSVAHKRK